MTDSLLWLSCRLVAYSTLDKMKEYVLHMCMEETTMIAFLFLSIHPFLCHLIWHVAFSTFCKWQNIDGVNYVHVKVAGLFFVVTTMVNISPSLLLELLQRIARVTKDYLGVLNEDSLRKNFILVYELLDEVIVSTLQSTLPFFIQY